MKRATFGLFVLVGAADMLWSPRLAEPASPSVPGSVSPTPIRSVNKALELYVSSWEPIRWEERRKAAAYLLAELNPPQKHRQQWELVGEALEKAAPPLTAWQCWQGFPSSAEAHGLFGPYQNRLSGLRRAQLQSSAEQLRLLLEKNDFTGYLKSLPRQGENRGPLALAVTLQPQSQVGQDDLIPPAVWWAILLNQSNHQALGAGLRLARGQTPEMSHRWEGRTCVCWNAGPDGQEEGGQLEASLDDPAQSMGDWVYRFR